MISIAFFDVDGTLIDIHTHRIPDSAITALKLMRERGIKCFIATGRGRGQIPPIIGEGIPGFGRFDGFLCFNGQFCFDDEGVFRTQPMDIENVRLIAEAVQNGRLDALFMEADYYYVNRHTAHIEAQEAEANLVYATDDPRRALDHPVYQMCGFNGPEDDWWINEMLPSAKTARWNDLFCDIIPITGGKGAGVAATLEHEGLTRDQAVAFGDGDNDVEMFHAVDTAVVMGNAAPATQHEGDWVAPRVDEDGLYRACVALGLIEDVLGLGGEVRPAP